MLPICQCLYLNIRTPDTSLCDSDPHAQRHKLLPVIVFFHGGDFHDGSGGRRFYYASNALPAYGNVVLVTFNYRCTAEPVAKCRVVIPQFDGIGLSFFLRYNLYDEVRLAISIHTRRCI